MNDDTADIRVWLAIDILNQATAMLGRQVKDLSTRLDAVEGHLVCRQEQEQAPVEAPAADTIAGCRRGT